MMGASSRNGNEVARKHLRRFHTGVRGTRQRSTSGSRSPGLRRLEPTHDEVSGTSPTFPSVARRTQRRLSLSRSPLPRLRYSPNRGVGHCAPAEDDADTRARTIYALQRLFSNSRLRVQAQPPGRIATNEDLGERSAVDVVAGREMIPPSSILAMKSYA
jgi:hypothetical protein